jgi:hypothetical protein
MAKDNLALLQKAAAHTTELLSDGGRALPEQQMQFFVRALTGDPHGLLKMIRTRVITAPEFQVERILFPEIVLQPSDEGVALPDVARTRASTSQVKITPVEMAAQMGYSRKFIEDNIEGEQFSATMRNGLAERIAANLADLMINGDTATVVPSLPASPTAEQLAAYLRARMLKVQNGLRKLATAHTVDYQGARLDRSILKGVVQSLPVQYLNGRYEFWTATNPVYDYSETLADKQTPAGDRAQEQAMTMRSTYRQINVLGNPLWPSTLGASEDRTDMVFFDPKNMIVAIRRQVEFEAWYDPNTSLYNVKATVRLGMKLEEENAIVKAENILASPDVPV